MREGTPSERVRLEGVKHSCISWRLNLFSSPACMLRLLQHQHNGCHDSTLHVEEECSDLEGWVVAFLGWQVGAGEGNTQGSPLTFLDFTFPLAPLTTFRASPI